MPSALGTIKPLGARSGSWVSTQTPSAIIVRVGGPRDDAGRGWIASSLLPTCCSRRRIELALASSRCGGSTPRRLRTSTYALSEAERNLAREDQRRRLAALVRSCEIAPTPSLVRLPPQVILPDNDETILLAAIAAEATHLLTCDQAHFGRYYGTRLAGV